MHIGIDSAQSAVWPGCFGDEPEGQVLLVDWSGRKQIAVQIANWEKATALVARFLGATFGRLVALIRKQQLENELDGEIAAHLELAERDALASGMSPEKARIAARRQFGCVKSMKDEHRDRRSLQWLEDAWRDVR